METNTRELKRQSENKRYFCGLQKRVRLSRSRSINKSIELYGCIKNLYQNI